MDLAINCPDCGSDRWRVLTSRRKFWRTPEVVTRRLSCHQCGGRWTRTDPAGLSLPDHQWKPPAKVTADQVVAILLSPLGHRTVAREMGISTTAARKIRCRVIHREVRPDLPEWTPPPPKPPAPPKVKVRILSCHDCMSWIDGKCREGWPDPVIEGPQFAADCEDYEPRKDSD